jgi:hypothetical protein
MEPNAGDIAGYKVPNVEPTQLFLATREVNRLAIVNTSID